jgi:hypothetical protein
MKNIFNSILLFFCKNLFAQKESYNIITYNATAKNRVK